MKNIFLLPTDKPSKMGFDSVKNLHFVNFLIDDYQNIYITSDEVIKNEDWCLLNNRLVVRYFKLPIKSNSFKKIILTTDQDLIKDGVQAIDDEFLEWFVKNQSCEYVETFIDTMGCTLENCDANPCINYKIIIPKEEIKNVILGGGAIPIETDSGEKLLIHKSKVLSKEEIMANRSSAYEFIDFNKQETLEEAAERLCPPSSMGYNNIEGKVGFIKGAKWAIEQISDNDIDDWLDYRINTLDKISFSNWFINKKK